MKNALRNIAEDKFAALIRRDEAVMSDIHSELRAAQEKTARLKALRLARDADTIAIGVARLKTRRS